MFKFPWNKPKKKNILVTINYYNTLVVRAEYESWKDVMKDLYKPANVRYEYWFQDDIDDQPEDGYKITNLKLEDGKVSEIELTEYYMGGYNNG